MIRCTLGDMVGYFVKGHVRGGAYFEGAYAVSGYKLTKEPPVPPDIESFGKSIPGDYDMRLVFRFLGITLETEAVPAWLMGPMSIFLRWGGSWPWPGGGSMLKAVECGIFVMPFSSPVLALEAFKLDGDIIALGTPSAHWITSDLGSVLAAIDSRLLFEPIVCEVSARGSNYTVSASLGNVNLSLNFSASLMNMNMIEPGVGIAVYSAYALIEEFEVVER